MHESSGKDAKRILISLVAGLVVGLILFFTMGESAKGVVSYISPIAEIFIRCLKMVIIPLVLSSIFMAVVNLGSPEKLGQMGSRAIIYYFITTAAAVGLGLIFVNLIQPGVGAGLGSAGLSGLSAEMTEKVTGNKGLFHTIVGVLVDAIPKNPFESMSETTVLQVIVFSIIFGIVAIYNPKKSGPIITVMKSLEDMTLALTHGIMKVAPIGIFVLMVESMATSGFDAIISLSKYMSVVVIGLSCHFIFLLMIASARLKKSPIFIIKGVAPALLTALSTSSSAATLPITMANVEDNLGVRKDTAKFVLPLGATINMDGTALYESVAVIFIAQAYGIDLTITNQIVIFMTASLAAVGAAAIPGAGLFTMSIVLSAVGLPLEGIGLILAVDRILDMFRTTVNVFGDCVGTIVVDSLLKDKGTVT